MKKIIGLTLCLVTSLLFVACGGGDDSDDNGGGSSSGGGSTTTLTEKTKARSLAFPGADGGASTITGGAGGSVYVVNSLADDGKAGTLRNALQSGSRTIVFTVGGQIDLKSKLTISNSNITIAGQTAPGDGITVAGYPVYISGSNIIIRFMRFRLGDQNVDKSNFVAEDGDALGAKDCKNVLIDHCSISWSTDECASFSRIENFTLQYCIISESLKLAGHEKGNHGYGGIWGGRNATYHHNLIADHDSRNPRFDHSYVAKAYLGPIDYANNVVFNWGSNSTYGGEAATEANVFHINMLNNYYQSGKSSKHTSRLLELTSVCSNCVSSTGQAYPGKFYLDGNVINGNVATWDNVDSDSHETRDKTTLKNNAKLTSRWTTGFTNQLSFVESASNAYSSVLAYAGASLVQDAVDKRIIAQIKLGTNGGAIINSQSEVGGYPTLSSGTALTDSDNDGMPDSWELTQMKALGVTKATVADFKPSAYNITCKYTNLEVYLNELVVKTFPSGAGAATVK